MRDLPLFMATITCQEVISIFRQQKLELTLLRYHRVVLKVGHLTAKGPHSDREVTYFRHDRIWAIYKCMILSRLSRRHLWQLRTKGSTFNYKRWPIVRRRVSC